MAAGLNSHKEAARTMSVNTIAISPSGARTPAVPAAAGAPRDHDLLPLDDRDDELLVEVGSVHEPSMLPMPLECLWRPCKWDDDEDVPVDVVCVMLVADESPTMDDSLVMISRNVGRIVGSWCQHEVMRSPYSSGTSSGTLGRRSSRMTATATAAGLIPA
jgi:hypothetical protein